ncbi:addiction module antidote protein [Devosia sp.]|uniref:addiction module antidote protein n=1 Tax=Devosia sp. TaxID=1871048 RepID=UPI002FCCAF1D
MTKSRKFDPANYLDDEAAVATYVSDALETGDLGFIADALGVAARARGMSKIATATGLSRESLYRALSVDGNPEFGTVLTVMAALGIRLTAEPAHPEAA